jgi:hypothetical protein
LSDINIGIEEFVDHSYFRQWEAQDVPADPFSGPLSPWHPWNKETIPFPAPRNWKERYSWNTAPRWDREAMETTVRGCRRLPSPTTTSSRFISPLEEPQAGVPKDALPARSTRVVLEDWGARTEPGPRLLILFTALIAYEPADRPDPCGRRDRGLSKYKVPKDFGSVPDWGPGAVT